MGENGLFSIILSCFAVSFVLIKIKFEMQKQGANMNTFGCNLSTNQVRQRKEKKTDENTISDRFLRGMNVW